MRACSPKVDSVSDAHAADAHALCTYAVHAARSAISHAKLARGVGVGKSGVSQRAPVHAAVVDVAVTSTSAGLPLAVEEEPPSSSGGGKGVNHLPLGSMGSACTMSSVSRQTTGESSESRPEKSFNWYLWRGPQAQCSRA